MKGFVAKYYPTCKKYVISAASFCKEKIKALIEKIKSNSNSQNSQYSQTNNGQAPQYVAPNNMPNNGQAPQYVAPNNMPNNAQMPQYGVPNYGQNHQYGAPNYMQIPQYGIQRHDIPKCTCCGYVGSWDVEPVLLPMHWAIGILLLLFCGTGILYLILVAAIRANKNNRAKICKNCKAHNMFTFMY